MHRTYHLFHFLHNRELDELYASIAMRSFALAMIGIFVPIYLLEKGFALQDVLIFYFTINISMAAFNPFAAKFAARYGFKHAILASLPIQVMFYLFLNFTESVIQLFLLGAAFGIAMSLFWISYHLDFSKFTSKRFRAEQISIANILSSVAQVFGPIAGAYIISLFSFNVLFIVASFLLASSALPLFLSKDVHVSWNFPLRNLLRRIKIKRVMPFFGIGIENAVAGVLWPIFVFTVFFKGSYEALGFLSALIFLFSMLFIFLAGRLSDENRSKALSTGAVFNSFVWGVKTTISSAMHVFIVDSFYGISKSMLAIPFDAKCYDEASHEGRLRFIVLRETFLHAGSASLFLLALFISEFKVAFIIAGIASLLCMFL